MLTRRETQQFVQLKREIKQLNAVVDNLIKLGEAVIQDFMTLTEKVSPSIRTELFKLLP